jgi:DNA-binding response OmpR family regulator
VSVEKVLVVEDDDSILLGLEMNLEAEGYQVVVAKEGPSALEVFEREQPDLVLLDLMLPGLDGFAVLEAIRRKDRETPVLVLSARDGQQDKIRGLDIGADDYVTKPFSLPELLARINAALRRRRVGGGQASQHLSFEDTQIDTATREVKRSGALIEMTLKEYELLVLLYLARGRVLTREQILRGVWGDDYEGTERTVDNFINRLRTKLETDPDNPRWILTVRGVGYRFRPTG